MPDGSPHCSSATSDFTTPSLARVQLYQRRLEGDQVMQQRQIDDQLLDLAHKDRQLLYLRDEVDGREASISKLHKKLVKYRLNLDSTKVGVAGVGEAEIGGLGFWWVGCMAWVNDWNGSQVLLSHMHCRILCWFLTYRASSIRTRPRIECTSEQNASYSSSLIKHNAPSFITCTIEEHLVKCTRPAGEEHLVKCTRPADEEHLVKCTRPAGEEHLVKCTRPAGEVAENAASVIASETEKMAAASTYG